MEFKEFKVKLQDNFKKISEDATHLFEVSVDKDELWETYLSNFPIGTNEIYRERRWHDCSCCRTFVKNFGNVVIIKDNKVKSIWDFEIGDTTYQPVIKALSEFIKSKVVSDIHISKLKKIGVDKNFETVDGKIKEWNHFYIELPSKFVDSSDRSVGDIKGSFRDIKNVFKRSLDEITEDSLLTVLELVSQNSLYKGEEWKSVLNQFLVLKREYSKLSLADKEIYTWEKSVIVGGVIGKIKNHSIGTLLINISEEMDLDLAVKKYEAIVAPENYKRSQPIYSKKMLEEAKKKLEKLGYVESLKRRFAVIDDITINNTLFCNRDSAKAMNSDIFDEMSEDIPVNPKAFSKIEEITINDFIKNVLPASESIEVMLDNKYMNNMVSLIAPNDIDSKTMFKWDNNFSWSYKNNVTDSMKERVKLAGGKVDGDLRFSIMWNEENDNKDDLDAHCIEANGNHIEFGKSGRVQSSSGMLDVDIINPTNEPAVENIIWTNISKMPDGVYKMFVNNYTNRGGKSGFRAEIEFNGQIYSFDYNKVIMTGRNVQVAEVTLLNGKFTIKEKLPSSVSSKEVWSLKTNKFIPVSIIMDSPNYWNRQKGIGNHHIFFMLKNCTNNENPLPFYNEFLNQELNEHRKVMEAMSSKLRIAYADNQLSGIGFSTTKRNKIIVRVTGQTKRMLKIKF